MQMPTQGWQRASTTSGRNRVCPLSLDQGAIEVTREDWLNEFTAELVVLRPHVGPLHARGVALITYGAMGTETHPKQAAMEYHARRERREGLPVGRKERSK